MDIVQELGKFLTPITESQRALDEVSAPFYGRGYIRPIQCRWAIDQLEVLETHVQLLSAYFTKTEHLPIVFIALRYRPQLTLRRMQKQISTLIGYLEDHLVLCMMPSEHLLQQRKLIQKGFETLSEYISDMPRQFQSLGDEARFQERWLVANLNN